MGRSLTALITLLYFILPTSVYALEFSLFGDTSYTIQDGSQTFAIGSFDLIADQHVSETSYITTDLVFETGEHGIEVELERFKITKETELTDITMGRFHKILGFWNHNFNHGSLSQDTASRPFFLELENSHEGIFPAHMVGLLLGKEYPDWSWQLAYGNNSGMNTDNTFESGEGGMESLNGSDPSEDKSTAFRGTYRLSNELELGLFLMANNVVETGGEEAAATPLVPHGDLLFTEEVVGLDVSYNTPLYYLFGEYYQLVIKDNPYIATTAPGIDAIAVNPDSYTATAYYLQFGYRYSDKIRIALRYENLDFEANATLLELHGLVPETRNVLAISYRLEDSNSLRFELNQSSKSDQDTETSYTIQWFFYLL